MSKLEEFYREVVHCPDCELAQHRTQVVPGEGSENAEIVFIGEAPGWHEDQQGRPFVGPAGQFLNELLASVGLKRADVYICNIIKCRPPGNRDPLPNEIKACQKWLDRQLELIRPKVMVTLGRYSMGKFFPGESIGKIHGKARYQDGIIYYPMYHPAAALHQQSLRSIIVNDMKNIPTLLTEAREREKEAAPKEAQEQPQQLSMF